MKLGEVPRGISSPGNKMHSQMKVLTERLQLCVIAGCCTGSGGIVAPRVSESPWWTRSHKVGRVTAGQIRTLAIHALNWRSQVPVATAIKHPFIPSREQSLVGVLPVVLELSPTRKNSSQGMVSRALATLILSLEEEVAS